MGASDQHGAQPGETDVPRVPAAPGPDMALASTVVHARADATVARTILANSAYSAGSNVVAKLATVALWPMLRRLAA